MGSEAACATEYLILTNASNHSDQNFGESVNAVLIVGVFLLVGV